MNVAKVFTRIAICVLVVVQQDVVSGRLVEGLRNDNARRLRDEKKEGAKSDEAEEEQMIQVVVGYHEKSGDHGPLPISKALLDSRHPSRPSTSLGKIQNQFKRVNAVSMTIPASQMSSLENDPSIAYVERDAMRYLLSEEITWGVAAVGAAVPPWKSDHTNDIPLPDPSADCFKVCIIDSGLMIGHPDIPFWLGDGKIEGRQFGIPYGQYWYNPKVTAAHGTHVTGTIFAKGGNDIGIAGVIPNNTGICLMEARVFADEAELGQQSSVVDQAVEWCADNGARVVNLSLGGSETTSTSGVIHERVHEEGVLVISASGNDGTTDYFYPASYDVVLSVAAVDAAMERANFSQYNDKVDVTAPGASILSTSPGIEIVDDRGTLYNGHLMEFSKVPDDEELSGDLVDCGLAATPCDAAEGKVCLIKRGNTTFAEKAHSCEKAGGIGAIIYNNVPDVFGGTLGASGLVDIPVLGLSREDGKQLLTSASIRLDFYAPIYSRLSGTSMASPHVTGVAARIWAARPECTNKQVREALETTAEDLGPPGRDDEYGHGLVNMARAYKYLTGLPPPCGIPGTPHPSGAPTRKPTVSPSERPSGTPSAGQTSFTPSETTSQEPTSLHSVVPPRSVGKPSGKPTTASSEMPSQSRSGEPTSIPSEIPSLSPSGEPTGFPSAMPSPSPSRKPTDRPSEIPSQSPSGDPTSTPSVLPSQMPSEEPTSVPSEKPSQPPSGEPMITHSETPPPPATDEPASVPSEMPSAAPIQVSLITPQSYGALSTDKLTWTRAPAMMPSQAPRELPLAVPPPSGGVPCPHPSAFTLSLLIVSSLFCFLSWLDRWI